MFEYEWEHVFVCIYSWMRSCSTYARTSTCMCTYCSRMLLVAMVTAKPNEEESAVGASVVALTVGFIHSGFRALFFSCDDKQKQFKRYDMWERSNLVSNKKGRLDMNRAIYVMDSICEAKLSKWAKKQKSVIPVSEETEGTERPRWSESYKHWVTVHGCKTA